MSTRAPFGRAGTLRAFMIRTLAPSLLATSLVACGASQAPAPTASAASPAIIEDPVAHIGDATVHASVMQTSALDAGVARNYGIARSDKTVLLLVAVRKGADAQEIALPATITAFATDLAGRKHVIAMRELRTGDAGSGLGQPLLDYVGSVEITLPDTLRFDAQIVLDDGAHTRLQFAREFFPR